MPYIEKEILSGVRIFLNGGQGAFDRAAARAVFKLKQNHPEIKNVLVCPYHNFKVFDKTLFDDIIFADLSNSISFTGYRAAIPKRNRFMVENSSTAICYVNHISGGAYKTYHLAQKKRLRLINIYNE